MVEAPENMLDRYVAAGCQRLIVHVESTIHLHRVLAEVRRLGAAAAVAINPSTPAGAVENVLDLVDMVLVMTVNPGFGGQNYLASMEPKIAEVRSLCDASGHDIDVEVDGGINLSTIGGAVKAGANVIVAGSALYRHPEGVGAAVAELRELALAV